MTDATLDLFDPMTIVQTLMYQASTDADYWEQQHIDAMVDLCVYLQNTYPGMYNKIKDIHNQFINRTATIY